MSDVPHGTEPEAVEATVFKPHPKQWQMMQCPCHEILYGGAAGGGKSKALGFDWTAHHAIHKGAAKGLLLRRTNSELEDMIRDLQNMFVTLPNPPTWKESKRIFIWPDGAVLEMGYLESWEDVYRYQGREFNWMGWDELTQWPTEDQYEYLLTRMRSSKGVKVRVISTTNPGGPGHAWVLARWHIDENPKGNKVYKKLTKVKDRDGKETEKIWTYVFIPALLSDNPSLDHDGEYRANLMNRGTVMKAMLLDGRWDVLEGAFFPEWNPDVHIVPDSIPPPSAKKWMAGDWGTTKPYCFLWAYEASNGDVIIYDELYGAVEGKNIGLRHNASFVAQLIREKERNWGHYVTERYLDIECFSMDGHEITVAGLFAKEGVHFQKAIKKNKAGGIENFREYLKVVNGVSRFKVMRKCRNLIRTLPRLQTDQRNPSQYDTDGEDHCLSGETEILTEGGWMKMRDLEGLTALPVRTPGGYRYAFDFRKTGKRQTYRMTLSNGHHVDATGDHRFLVVGKGFVRLDEISYGDTLLYGGPHAADSDFGDDSGIPGDSVLPVWSVLPTRWSTAASDGVDLCERAYPEGVACPSCGRESCEQCSDESRIEAWARAYETPHDARETSVVAGECEEGDCSGPGVASVGGWKDLAQEARRSLGGADESALAGCTVADSLMLLVHERVRDKRGLILLQGGLPNAGSQTRHYGVRVEGIRPQAIEDVYDCAVDGAHCFLTRAGVFAHNCADAALYLVRRNTPTEEEIKKKARTDKGRLYLDRQIGPYGIY